MLNMRKSGSPLALKNENQDWRNGPEVKSITTLARGSRFGSQHPNQTAHS